MKKQQVKKGDELKEPPKRKRIGKKDAELFRNKKLDLELETHLKELLSVRKNLHNNLTKASNLLIKITHLMQAKYATV